VLEAYRDVAPRDMLDEIYLLAKALKGLTFQHVNSTRTGGGVAEILRRFVPLTESLGLGTRWDVVAGTPEFFEVTKAFHNALQGGEADLSHRDYEVYLECLRENARRLSFEGDLVVLHDPQPVYLADFLKPAAGTHVVWRCHIDVSRPNARVWRFLRRAVVKCQAAIFHVPQFAQDLPIPQLLIAPSIDPLSDKNRDLSEAEVSAVTDRYGIDRARPVLVQISRFDRFKDPLGVIEAYRPSKVILFGSRARGDAADTRPARHEALPEGRHAGAQRSAPLRPVLGGS